MLSPISLDIRDHLAASSNAIRSPALATAMIVAVLCGALAIGARPSVADEIGGEAIAIPAEGPVAEPAAENDWQFEIAPYAWFVFIAGETAFLDQGAEVDVTFGDIWKQLHMAFMLDAEVRKGDIGFYTDLNYTYLWQRTTGVLPGATYKINLHMVLFDFGLYYEALKLDFGSERSAPRLRLQPFVGGRYLFLGLVARRDPGKIFIRPPPHTAAPILGLRGFLDIDEHWNLSFVGDGGGFGVDGVHSTWQAELLAGYRGSFSLLDLNLMIGYKGIGIDQRASVVSSDLILHGPVLKLGFEF